MDSHLSNAQRCARKADSLVKYDMYDEALIMLDKSIVYLYELKSLTTRYENIQMLNVQIESIDRKKRSVAIKRSESIKKKNRINTLVNQAKNPITSPNTNNNIRIQHIPANVPKPKCDQSPVIIEYCFNNDNGQLTRRNNNQVQEAMFVQGRKKLDKDDKSIIEELSTTNAEYKKVNSYLADEIEQLKRENDQLKVELIKIHMTDSLTENELGNSSTPKNQNIRQSTYAKSLNCSDNSMTNHTVPCYHMNQISSGSSSTSSSSWSISQSSQATNSSHNGTNSSSVNSSGSNNNNNKIQEFKSIDLSKYLENDDYEDEEEEDFRDGYDGYENSYQNCSGDSNGVDRNCHHGGPPLEFNIDSC